MDSAKEQARPGITRRGFLKGGTLAALGLAASGLAGCNGEGAAAAAKGNLPESWDAEADVVVIGMGGAGLSAAIAAKMAGAESVMVLEAAPEEEWRRHHARVGRHAHDPRRRGGRPCVPDHAQRTLRGGTRVHAAWAEGVVENYAWLTDELGFELGDATAGRPEFPGTEGGESIKTYYVDGICGMSSLWIPLVDKADELGVSFEYNAAPSSWRTSGRRRRCAGVLTEDGRAFKARRGVVMACGGFASNPDMMQNYMASMGCPNAFPLGSPYNVGDGVKMAQRIGADLWHMNSYAAASTCVRAISPGPPPSAPFSTRKATTTSTSTAKESVSCTRRRAPSNATASRRTRACGPCWTSPAPRT